MDSKFDWNDITIIPETLSIISSRSEIDIFKDGKLPLFTAPIVHNSACTTSANVAVHYPMASLISECYKISKEFEKPTKIIADGGFKNYSDILKALALGASYVMIGSLFNKTLESCSDTFIDTGNRVGERFQKVNNPLELYVEGVTLYKYYRGMSTKEVQKDWNRVELKTGEGISKYNMVECTLGGWCENFSDYLKSVMSYTNSLSLLQYIGETKYVRITQNAFNRFNK